MIDNAGDLYHYEPAVVTAIAAALLGVLVAFGAPLTPDQRDALLKLVAILAPLAAGLIVRRKVTPNKTLEDAGLSPQVVKAQAAINGSSAGQSGPGPEEGRS